MSLVPDAPPPSDQVSGLRATARRISKWLDRRTDAFLKRTRGPYRRAVKGLDKRYDRLSKWRRKRTKRATKWVRAHEIATIGIALGLVAIGIAIAGYSAFKRPSDVSNPNASFKVHEAPGGETPRTSWPIYGRDESRTKSLPGDGLDPPLKQQWVFEAHKLLEFPPVYANGSVYGMNNDALFFALDAKTGKPRWQRKIGSLNASTPAYADGKLFGVNLEPQQAFALDAETGQVLWKTSLPGRAESSPLAVDGKVYFGCECNTLYALDQKTGKVIWKTPTAGAVKAAPAMYKGVLYVGDYGGQMSAIRASNGSVVWKTGSQGASFGRSGEFYSTAAIAFGRLYAGNNDGRLYSFELKSGDLAWSHSLGGYVYSGPAVADIEGTGPTVYVGSFDNRLHALDAKDGGEKWSADIGGNVSGAIAVIGHTVYASNVDTKGTLGFDVKSHKRVAKLPSGSYTPMISDGTWLYNTGYSSIRAYKPVPKK
jgi:outer membrane protein assembly factor BamB